MPETPTTAMPRPLAEAVETLTRREQDLAEAHQRAREAEAGVQEARAADRMLYVRLRDEDVGADDPGTPNETAAVAALATAQRQLEGERLRRARAEDALRAALDAHGDEWQTALDSLQQKTAAEGLRALDKLAASEQRRDEARAAADWLAKYRQSRKLAVRAYAGPLQSPLQVHPNDPAGYPLSTLVDALRATIAGSTPSARREELVPALLQLVAQLGNYVNIEREHGDKLYALLVEMMRRLATSYDIELPPGWPESGADALSS